MRVKFLRAGFVADQNPIARDNFPDATQFQFRKFLPPGVQQLHRVAAGNREQQFKILAVGQRGGKWCFWRGERPRERLVGSLAPPSFAARETGIAPFNNSAPTPLAFKMCRKSPASPSLKSIIAWMEKCSASQRASSSRGSNSRCFSASEPPSSPVTKIASPVFAPERRTCFPRATVPSSAMEMKMRSGIRRRLAADNGDAVLSASAFKPS